MVHNPKLDGPVSQEATAAPNHQHEREAMKDGTSTDQPESSQVRTGPRSKSLTGGKVNPDAVKSPEEVATKQDKVLEVKVETSIEAETSSR
jgi:hypothetical protein